MKNVCWVRIDDRLIHGQVMTQWLQTSGANEVLIIDNGVAKDKFLQMIMKASIPEKIVLKVKTVQDGIDYLLGPADKQKIFILVKVPTVLVSLVDAGVMLPFINVGGMGARTDRSSLYRNVSANQEEREQILYLIRKGVRCFFRAIKSDPEEDATKYVS